MLQEKLPHIARFSWACYGKPSRLYYKPPRCRDAPDEAGFIESEDGCQQGANDGSADFAIGLQPTLLCIRERHPGITVSAGHDDVQFTGNPFGVVAALRDFRASAAPIGLELNTTKTKVYSMGVEALSRKAVKKAFKDLATIVPSTEGITLMGSPRLFPEFFNLFPYSFTLWSLTRAMTPSRTRRQNSGQRPFPTVQTVLSSTTDIGDSLKQQANQVARGYPLVQAPNMVRKTWT